METMPTTTQSRRTLANETLLDHLRWRYATKKFDVARKISAQDWATLEETLVLSPSSFGLQPWKFFVVADPAVRAKIQPVARHQTQIVDASHLVVFTVKKNLGPADVQKLIDRIVEQRKVPAAALEPYKDLVLGRVNGLTPDKAQNWSSRQVYIAMGMFLAAAAMMGIDTCPIEGLEPKKVDEILGLEPQGYATLAIVVAGYRAADDKYSALAKVRYPASEVIAVI